jgi:hypothetical protein
MNGALAGLVILVIGDSQMMNMVNPLHNQLEGAGAVVHTYAMCGATAADWVYPSAMASCGHAERHDKAPPTIVENQGGGPAYLLNDLIAKNHPNLVVVELGDTMANFGMAQIERSWVLDQVRALTGAIAASRIACDWIGPIWGQQEPPYQKSDARVKEMSDLLSQSVAPCKYIDSTTMARPGEWPTRDGTHFQPDGYRKWSAALTEAIVRLNGQGSVSTR